MTIELRWVQLVAVMLTGGLVKPTTMNDLTFLTREGCVNTPDMMFNLDDALTELSWPTDDQFIDIGRLLKTDPRTGFSTPTVLWKRQDIFGMPDPTLPASERS